MAAPHLRTLVAQVKPVVIQPPCGRGTDRDCRTCKRLGKCESPVSWCCLKYNGKKHGCPNYRKNPACPPLVRLFDEEYDTNEPVVIIACEFDLAHHMNHMAAAHPDWNERQLRNVLYWQGAARKTLKEAIVETLKDYPGYTHTMGPEAMGIDLRPVMREAFGVELLFQPVGTVWKIAMAGKPRRNETK